jgi:hypothetical protein
MKPATQVGQDIDLAPITQHFRAMYRSRLLVTAVTHFPVFAQFADGPLTFAELGARVGLKERPTMVLIPALCAMGLLAVDKDGKVNVTAYGRALSPTTTPNLISYMGLEADDPGVLEMAQRLQNDGPLQSTGTAYIKEAEAHSPMDDPETARSLTLALAGRARYLAPLVAAALPTSSGHLLDVAAGTGLYAYEWLRINPQATATVLDRPEVLVVAAELLDEFGRNGQPNATTVKKRVTFLPGDMLTDELPRADLLLAASLFHDWPTETCQLLAKRFTAVLNPGGELWVHDAFLDDTLDGPLAVTDYSAQLFWITKGRAYSRQEYYHWFTQAGLLPGAQQIATRLDYGLISACKPR